MKYWVPGRQDGHGSTRAIPLEVSDPVLLPYFRNSMSDVDRSCRRRPAAPPSTRWNELTLGGQISYSDDIKQIVALRRTDRSLEAPSARSDHLAAVPDAARHLRRVEVLEQRNRQLRVRPNISLNSPTSSDDLAAPAQSRDDVVDRRRER